MTGSESLPPTALVRPDEGWSIRLRRASVWIWLLVVLSLLAALALSWQATVERGPEITIRFRDGHGLKPEDTLRFRGIDVGQVTAVQLRRDLRGVDVRVRLSHGARDVAREGSQFWIERPRLGLQRMRGLDTIVGAKYVGVIPGDPQGPAAYRFEGLDTPPTLRGPTDTTIRVAFRDGYGISAGNEVKYRGIVVGEVSSVRLDATLAQVIVEARLLPSAHVLARRGSLFWVERPKVSLQGVRGLETLVGGAYLAVLPDPQAEEAAFEFEGVHEPPPFLAPVEQGLLLTLEADEQFGLERGALVTYRGVDVGQVVSVELSDTGRAVEILLALFPEYVSLVRENTIFWSRSGLDFHVGLGGLDVDMAPLASLAAAGVALATPDPPGPPVASGSRFPLRKEAPKDWWDWKPDLDARRAKGRAEADTDRPFLERLRARFGGGP